MTSLRISSKLQKNLSVVLALTFFASMVMVASDNGYSGATRKSGTTGCSCHGSVSTAVTVAITGPDTLTVGQTGSYSVKITGGPAVSGGVDIAVSSGTLIAGTGMKLKSSELTHSAPKLASSGAITFNYTYTAPATVQTVTMYSTGNSTNNTGGTSGDQWNFSPNKTIVVKAAVDVKDDLTVNGFALNQNYPNPFNPSTVIAFSLAEATNINLSVFDIKGNLVKVLSEGNFAQGNHQVNFDASNLSTGVYIYKLQTNKTSISKKMILVK